MDCDQHEGEALNWQALSLPCMLLNGWLQLQAKRLPPDVAGIGRAATAAIILIQCPLLLAGGQPPSCSAKAGAVLASTGGSPAMAVMASTCICKHPAWGTHPPSQPTRPRTCMKAWPRCRYDWPCCRSTFSATPLKQGSMPPRLPPPPPAP